MQYKYITSTLITFLFSAIFSLSAQTYTVDDGTIIHRDKSRSCIEVHVDPEPKTVKDAWKDFLKDNYDFKLKGFGFLTNKDLLSAEDVQVEKISDKNLNFYSNIVEDKEGTEMKVFASYGYDIYLNKTEYPSEYATIKNMVAQFYAEFLPDYYKGEIKDITKKIAGLEKDRKSNAKDIEDNKEDIDDNQKEIEKLQKENKDLAKELEENEGLLKTATERKKSREAKLSRIQNMVK
jgi:hypothetical protein